MAVRSILVAPDKRLKVLSKPVEKVDAEIHALLDDLMDTMYAGDGLGLAAIQVGVPKRVIVVDVHEPADAPAPLKLVNPEILWFSPERIVYEEGCLSFPEYFADVERASAVRVRYLDENGDENIHAENRLRTGDLGIMLEDGCIQVTGRAKDLIIRGGVNISPGIWNLNR